MTAGDGQGYGAVPTDSLLTLPICFPVPCWRHAVKETG